MVKTAPKRESSKRGREAVHGEVKVQTKREGEEGGRK